MSMAALDRLAVVRRLLRCDNGTTALIWLCAEECNAVYPWEQYLQVSSRYGNHFVLLMSFFAGGTGSVAHANAHA